MPSRSRPTLTMQKIRKGLNSCQLLNTIQQNIKQIQKIDAIVRIVCAGKIPFQNNTFLSDTINVKYSGAKKNNNILKKKTIAAS